ncbi:TerB family tellurite resistance protein [Shewanella sp. A3A]|uniref:TerB family tellurite resistance protein n=1 Tax=Shewanella electrica TaxID=515560 RepID=A0ABT2FN54_9GAMM|nr:TerB family tellurite resistance protein [Shewanella electrica]MCH1919565.1 TerB family tellurite resistance protein [Shewanella ferrihydritica]MCH1926263.1 TerB family tellurite resistance protein [Shewanella electrica]MCS4557769.1 TerB family tellurite resistance protein [Shewanella electrica]
MIAKLKQFLSELQETPNPEQQAHQLRLAAACMLLEVVFADEEMSADEASMLPTLLAQTLDIDSTEAQALIEEAKQRGSAATSLFEFTSVINDNFSIEQKQQLVLAMWQIAYADGHLCQYEDQIIRRCADLLYLKHSELIQLRNKAMA